MNMNRSTTEASAIAPKTVPVEITGRQTHSEHFADGSIIETDIETGNRTVIGKLAHAEYFKRLQAEQITKITDPAVISFCTNLDGTRKAELIRRHVLNALSREWLGEYSWEVWDDTDPKNVVRYMSEEIARKAFRASCLHGTNP